MVRFLLVVCITLISLSAFSQGFEVIYNQESHKGVIGEVVKAPIRLKNTSDKTIILLLRRSSQQIGSTQKNFFCVNNNCLDQRVEEYQVKLEPGQTSGNLQIALEAGLVAGINSSVGFTAFNKANPAQAIEFEVHFAVDDKPEKATVYTSRLITVNDVYPNPVVNHATVNYTLLNDRVKAKITLHNLLGNIIGEYYLIPSENSIRIKTDDLNAGIYFYTLYLDNESVMTRKMIIKK